MKNLNKKSQKPHTPLPDIRKLGLEPEIASHDMGVKPVFPVAVSPHRIPEPALGITKLGTAYVSKRHGEINVRVAFRASHLNGQIAPGKLKILVSRNVLHIGRPS